jgi:hypothetical protein
MLMAFFVEISNWDKIKAAFFKGSDVDLEHVVTDVNGNVVNLTAEEITFRIKDDIGGTTVVEKKNLKAGGSEEEIESTDLVNGKYVVHVNRADTINLDAKGYVICAFFTTDGPSYLHYRFNETSGIIVSDASVNNRDGTTQNNPSFATGKLNNAIQLNGIDQHVDCGDIADFEKDDAFSVDGWIKVTGVGDMIVARTKNDVTRRGWAVLINADGKLRFQLVNNTATNDKIIVDGSTMINDDNWYYFAVVYTGNEVASGVTMYVNGSEETKNVINDSLTATISTDVNLLIGDREALDSPLSGLVDELAIYEFAIDLTHVTNRYNDEDGIESIEPADNFVGSFSNKNFFNLLDC